MDFEYFVPPWCLNSIFMKYTTRAARAITIFFTVVLMLGCGKSEIPKLEIIKYGSYSSNCVGKCNIVLTISKSTFNLVKRDMATLDAVDCVQFLNNSEFKALTDKIDVEKFNALNENYEHPCADCPTEWIEIQQQDGKHRVTFTSGTAPDAVKPYLDALRSYAASFTACN